MKYNLSKAALLSLCAALCFSSCTNYKEVGGPEDNDSPVTFKASLDDGSLSRTALDMKFVPSWENTDVSMMHLYQLNGAESLEGGNVSMTVDETDSELAWFQADFASTSGRSFVYAGVLARSEGGFFYIPATQHPATVKAQDDTRASLFDPNADFLVAKSKADYAESQSGKKVELGFVRPVAVSRLAITNVQGESIKKVIIESDDALTGKVDYATIAADGFQGTFRFNTTEGSKTVTLLYENANPLANSPEGVVYAYFFCTPGSHAIKSFTVETESYSYVKTYETPLTMVFSSGDFKQIAVDMGKLTPTPVVGPGSETEYSCFFDTAKWAVTSTSDFSWESGKEGYGYSNNGVQITAKVSANATTNSSFTDVTKVVVTYNTNKGNGAGAIEIKVGSNDAKQNTVAYPGAGDGTTALYTTTFEYSTPQSGKIKLTATATTNSLYIVGVKVTAAGMSN